jgi:hypothetical protein
MDALRDFHGVPPWMNFPRCYHTIIISTINSWTKALSVLARYVQLQDHHAAETWNCRVLPESNESPFLQNMHDLNR